MTTATITKYERREQARESARWWNNQLTIRENITLNGEPAIITSWQEDFAIVYSTVQRMGVEFAWETVDTILSENGRFFS